jgi:predicted amidohydrolase YtcJ
MVIVNGDCLAVPDDRTDELEPAMTIVGGKAAFDASQR